MSLRFEIEDAGGRRLVEPADFPLAIGGEGCDLQLPRWQGTLAWLGLDAGDLFLQPADGQRVSVDGVAVDSSHWLRLGDQVELGAGGMLRVESADVGLRLHATADPQAWALKAPRLIPPPRADRRDAPPPRPIEPVVFTPARSAGAAAGPTRRPLLRSALILLLVAALGAVAAFLFTARSVEIEVFPEPDRLVVTGDSFSFDIGGRRLMIPGAYSLRASKDGYETLEAHFAVSSEARQAHSFELRKLPGLLAVTAVSASALNPPKDLASVELDPSGFPVDLPSDLDQLEESLPPFSAEQEAEKPGALNANIEIDGKLHGQTPIQLELEPGEYRLRVSAERHAPFDTQIEIDGAGSTQRIDIVLTPRWSKVIFISEPAGARLAIDGEDHGTTPTEVELLEGVRRYRLSRAGYAPREGTVEVVAGDSQRLGPVTLRPSDGNLSITSQPTGATVTVGGNYRGETPLELSVSPGREHQIRVSKAGYDSEQHSLSVAADGAQDLHLELRAQLGTVSLSIFPPDAEVTLDGEIITERRLNLPATVTYSIAARREGYLPFTSEITPLAGHEQNLEVRLEAEAIAREREVQRLSRTSEGHELKIIEPGRFTMGASRREPGRRANETLREIELTRSFYLSAHEITNEQFRRFRPEHRSGTVGDQSLDLDSHPVVQLTWQDAAAYCNWLSAKEGLEPAYVKTDDGLAARSADAPPANGYRLPTEAEWAWAARFPGEEPLKGKKFSWGPSLPVPEKAGNYADPAASDLVSATLSSYRDGFAATAPVDAFGPDERGLYQLSGNVAEWMHDVYVVRPPMVGAVERDPQGPPNGDFHVIRGASWMHSTISELRLSFRDYGAKPRPDLGFRIVRPLP